MFYIIFYDQKIKRLQKFNIINAKIGQNKKVSKFLIKKIPDSLL